MPLLLLLLLAAATGAQAQNLVLLDKEWREPLSLATAESNPVDHHLFPVYQSDIDSVIELTEWYIHALEDSRHTPNINHIKSAGASKFVASTNLAGNKTTFQLNLVTRCGQSGYSMPLVDGSDGPKKRLQKLRAFLDYLRNNQFLVSAPRQ